MLKLFKSVKAVHITLMNTMGISDLNVLIVLFLTYNILRSAHGFVIVVVIVCSFCLLCMLWHVPTPPLDTWHVCTKCLPVPTVCS